MLESFNVFYLLNEEMDLFHCNKIGSFNESFHELFVNSEDKVSFDITFKAEEIKKDDISKDDKDDISKDIKMIFLKMIQL